MGFEWEHDILFNWGGVRGRKIGLLGGFGKFP